MAVKIGLRSAFATDTGRRRKQNEDLPVVDAENGIFGVIDGVGGHAAGEHAAATARDVILERLRRPTGTPRERIREAIALANNEIYRLSRTRPDWAGMACVLTVALIEDNAVTVGHVGDSRLYLLQPGKIEKKTHDHSPVGEREDRDEIGELEAMRHARRNEIYRDVGSSERDPEDPAFIEVLDFELPDDGALLFCSDGLTDLITRAQIQAGLERYAPDYDKAIKALIDAANHAGGKDNITVVVVAGPDYAAPPDTAPTAAFAARPRPRRWLFAMAGLALGAALGFAAARLWQRFAPGAPVTITVGADGIEAALNRAHPGDTVLIPQGAYKEHIRLREGVALRARQPDTVTIASPDAGPAVVAQKIESGSLEGVWLQGAGIEITDAAPTISNDRITGAQTGILIKGHSEPLIISSQILHNLGPGIMVEAGAKPRIEFNQIAANGEGQPGIPSPGVEVAESARPVLRDNTIVDNAAEPVRIHGRIYQPADFDQNFFGGIPAKQAIRLADLPEPVAAPTQAERPKALKPGVKR